MLKEPYIYAMFKLGEYYEGETKPIVNYLKDAGIKVEQKISLYAIPDASDYLEGRLSELRGEIKDIETYERYLEALRAALAKGATPDDVRDQFYCELDPVWAEKKRQAEDILTNPSAALSDEENEAARKKLIEIMNEINVEDAVEMAKAFDFAVTTLSRNEIEPDQEVGDRLADPILRIIIDPEEYKDHKLFRQTLFVDFEKQYELYIDEFSAPLYEEIDEEFEDSYPEEYFKIRALGILIKDLAEEASPGKIDMESFSERCDLELENQGNILAIDGTDVAEEIARALEKNGVIKIKGDMIKWRT
jgi:hypothetical protein